MNTSCWIRRRGVSGLMALALCVMAPGALAGQRASTSHEQADDAAGFKEFSGRVQAYLKLQHTVESGLPSLKPTDLPEMITAHQQALARKIREARPHAKPGDIFTDAAREAFRHASRAALGASRRTNTHTDSEHDGPNTGMRLTVNGLYPDTEPVTALPPELLAAFPTLPAEIAYRVVGRTLILLDVQSRLIVDLIPLLLPPAS